jgi:hypothetical protein
VNLLREPMHGEYGVDHDVELLVLEIGLPMPPSVGSSERTRHQLTAS